jgi:ankyrin repeat protein
MANKFLKAVFIIAEDIIEDEKRYNSVTNLADILTINGRDLDLGMLFLNKELSGRIDSNTLIFINAHGTIIKESFKIVGENGITMRPGEHIISLNNNELRYYPSSKLIGKIEKLTKSPLKFFLDSCHSSDGIKYAMRELKAESVLVTNAKENHNSVASFTNLELNYWLKSLADSDNISNPYVDFIRLFDIKAMQYAKFITKKGVFEPKPDLEILLSPELARDFLTKEVDKFIKFASTRTWNGNKVILDSRQFSNEEVKSFSGNLFHHLCGLGEKVFLSFIIKNINSNIYLKNYIDHTPVFDQPINIASIGGHIKIVETLLAHGADINAIGHRGSTPLTSAISHNHIELAELLIERDADVNIISVGGFTAFLEALESGHIKIAKLLISHHANVNHVNGEGATALHRAVVKQKINVVEFLLENKANINTSLKDGMTPLHSAVNVDSLELVELLLSHGAEVNNANNKGFTPLMEAITINSFEMVEILVKHGADINAVENNGIPALVYAAIKSERLEIAKFLIQSGADTALKIPRLDDQSILEFFRICEFDDLVATIVDKEAHTPIIFENSTCENNDTIELSGEMHSLEG